MLSQSATSRSGWGGIVMSESSWLQEVSEASEILGLQAYLRQMVTEVRENTVETSELELIFEGI